jgi:cytochrome c oxidase cbb3-type subunit 3
MKNIFIILIGLFSSNSLWAAGNAGLSKTNTSPYQSPVFYLLCFIAVILLIFIYQFQRVFLALSKDKIRKMKEDRKKTFQQGGLLLFLFGITDTGKMLGEMVHHGLGNTPMNALAFIVLVEAFVVLYYAQQIRKLTEKPSEYEAWIPEQESVAQESKFWKWFNKSVDIAEEDTIMTDHDYDGIRELDNSLPPWWKYGFYVTIVVAIIYMGYYHMGGSGPSSLKEYQNQMDQAAMEIAAYQATQKDAVNEKNVVLLDNQSDIQAGAATFQSLCVACHGTMAEGKVGPNLTDDYWKNGGDIKDLFKTIKYGVKGTGMKSWKTDISASQIAQVASYILSLKGSNPPGAKAPEGSLYQSVVSDTLVDTNKTQDTLQTALK